jgi:hypothetical protein
MKRSRDLAQILSVSEQLQNPPIQWRQSQRKLADKISITDGFTRRLLRNWLRTCHEGMVVSESWQDLSAREPLDRVQTPARLHQLS